MGSFEKSIKTLSTQVLPHNFGTPAMGLGTRRNENSGDSLVMGKVNQGSF